MFYTQVVPYKKSAPPPPPGDAAGFNFRLTEGAHSDGNNETRAAWELHPHVYNLVGGGTYTAGWHGTFNNSYLYNTAGVTDRRLGGGVGLSSGDDAVFLLAHGAGAAGTYRVRCAFGLYVQFSIDLDFFDGYNKTTTARGGSLLTVSVLNNPANNWSNVDSVSRNEASWVSSYDSTYADLVVTDQGDHTALAMGRTIGASQYVAHLQVEKIA